MDTADTAFSSEAFLFQKDAYVHFRGTRGQLALEPDALIFTPTGDGNVIKIELSNIAVADFNNIFAKAQFIIVQKDGAKTIFGFAGLYTWKNIFIRQVTPLPGLVDIGLTITNTQRAEAWKKALIPKLSPEVVKQRVEVRARNVVIGSLVAVGLIIAALAAVVYLSPR